MLISPRLVRGVLPTKSMFKTPTSGRPPPNGDFQMCVGGAHSPRHKFLACSSCLVRVPDDEVLLDDMNFKRTSNQWRPQLFKRVQLVTRIAAADFRNVPLWLISLRWTYNVINHSLNAASNQTEADTSHLFDDGLNSRLARECVAFAVWCSTAARFSLKLHKPNIIFHKTVISRDILYSGEVGAPPLSNAVRKIFNTYKYQLNDAEKMR